VTETVNVTDAEFSGSELRGSSKVVYLHLGELDGLFLVENRGVGIGEVEALPSRGFLIDLTTGRFLALESLHVILSAFPLGRDEVRLEPKKDG